MVESAVERSPQVYARMAGVFWLMTIFTGALALSFVSGRIVTNLIATASYLVATLLVYFLLKPVNRSVSLLAAFFSIVGSAIGTLNMLDITNLQINSLTFFGLHCLFVGYLIFKSTFLPRILGVLLAFGGLSWLTFFWPPLAKSLSPFNLAPGIIGEGALSLWLIFKGVNVDVWKSMADGRFVLRKAPNV